MKRFLSKDITAKSPLIIAGPCSAESESQVMAIASALYKDRRISAMRAGIWKPRTRPGNFEGVGEIGLPWLQNAKKEFGLPFGVEVADAKQLDLALKHDVDYVWIGARTTANPFSVQSLANAIKGLNIPVLIKNPTNPDIELWIGAVERIQHAGISQIGLVHRGFTIYGSKDFRNPPMYELAIEMKRRFHTLPFIMDPSHIGGKRFLIKQLLQRGIDLDYDGAIIEVHTAPDNALSDKHQQIKPEELFHILDELVWRVDRTQSEDFNKIMDLFREKLDRLDDKLLHLLNERMKISREIGAYKKENNITILQLDRLNHTLERILMLDSVNLLSRDFLIQFLQAVHLESIKHQDTIMNENQHEN